MFYKIINTLYSYGLEIVVLTNDFLIDKIIRCIPKNNLVIELSIENIYPKKFYIYTRRRSEDLQVVLRILELVYNNSIDLVIETIFIPKFNDKDVELIARYIATRLGNDIPLIIDEYVPASSTLGGSLH
jgi:pyruvate-formate lyase-activating enzyme